MATVLEFGPAAPETAPAGPIAACRCNGNQCHPSHRRHQKHANPLAGPSRLDFHAQYFPRPEGVCQYLRRHTSGWGWGRGDTSCHGGYGAPRSHFINTRTSGCPPFVFFFVNFCKSPLDNFKPLWLAYFMFTNSIMNAQGTRCLTCAILAPPPSCPVRLRVKKTRQTNRTLSSQITLHEHPSQSLPTCL